MNNAKELFVSSYALARTILDNTSTSLVDIDQLLDALGDALRASYWYVCTDEQRIDLVMMFAAVPERSTTYAHMGRMLELGKHLNGWAHDRTRRARLNNVLEEVIIAREMGKGTITWPFVAGIATMCTCKCFVDRDLDTWADLVHHGACKHSTTNT